MRYPLIFLIIRVFPVDILILRAKFSSIATHTSVQRNLNSKRTLLFWLSRCSSASIRASRRPSIWSSTSKITIPMVHDLFCRGFIAPGREQGQAPFGKFLHEVGINSDGRGRSWLSQYRHDLSAQSHCCRRRAWLLPRRLPMRPPRISVRLRQADWTELRAPPPVDRGAHSEIGRVLYRIGVRIRGAFPSMQPLIQSV